MRTSTSFIGMVAAALLAACAPAEDGIGSDAAAEADDDAKGDRAVAPDAAFYAVERDPRQCAAPGCGGFWVQRVGRKSTTCADGSGADRCYVADLDVARLALDDAEASALRAEPARLILRGGFATRPGVGAVLAVKEAYRGAEAALPATIYALSDSGVRCSAAPCFSLLAAKLNSTVRVELSGLEGSLAAAVHDELAVGPVLVSGSWRTVKDAGPAGDGRVLAPAQLWTAVTAQNPASCKDDSECVATAYSRFVASPAECYCPACEDGVVNRATLSRNRESWERHCAGVRLACGGEACAAAPVARCVAARCSVE